MEQAFFTGHEIIQIPAKDLLEGLLDALESFLQIGNDYLRMKRAIKDYPQHNRDICPDSHGRPLWEDQVQQLLSQQRLPLLLSCVLQ